MHLLQVVEPSKTNQDEAWGSSMLSMPEAIHSIAKTQLFGSLIVCLIIYCLPSFINIWIYAIR